MKKQHRGFTLMELLIAAAILAAILTIGILFIRTSTQDFQFVSKEFTVQNGVRASMNNIANVTKEATAIFTVGQDKFDPTDPSKMTDGWSYIGLDKNQEKLINYLWVWTDVKNKKGIRKEVDITPSEWNIQDKDNKKVRYEIGFYLDKDGKAMKPEEEELLRSRKMVKMSIKGTVLGTETSYDLSNDIIAENLNQIMDSRSTKTEPITALAYKVDYLEDPQLGVSAANAAVVFVVDISGSMKRSMDGKIEKNPDHQRIHILKRNVNKFIEELEKSGNIDLYFVPFERRLYGDVNDGTLGTVTDIDGTQIQGTTNYSIEEIYFHAIEQLPTAHIGSWWGDRFDLYGKALKNGAATILSLYENAVWSDSQIESESRAIIKKIEDGLADLNNTVPDLTGSTPQAERRKKVEVIGELSKSCMELLKQPYTLSNTLAGTPNVQSVEAKKYVQTYLNASNTGDTNIGAGIREGYKILQKSDRKLKYLVVLSDGQPTFFDYQGATHSFQVFSKSHDGVAGTDRYYGAVPGTHVATGRSGYKYVGAGEGDLVEIEPGLYGYVGPKRSTKPYNGDYIDDGYRYANATDDPKDVKYFFWTGQDVVSQSKSYYPRRTSKPAPGQPVSIDHVFRSTGRINPVIKTQSYFKPIHYIEKVMSSDPECGMNIKNPDGTYFVKQTFLIGFSALSWEKDNMEKKMVGYSQAGGGTEKTVYLDASSDVSLGAVFKEVVEVIQKDLWYFEGP